MLSIVIGALLSGLVAPINLIVASVVAFSASELADFTVFTPLQRRGLTLAVVASGVIGIAVDSMLFLTLAYGSLEFLPGQVIGKSWALLLALPFVQMLRYRDRRLGLLPA